ncbi:IS4 family transposase [Pedobacter alpinus]|uniref:IS4 family transposase n=4 Tax=Pedobacter alpinus TaxID=1590643 RepID=A0ABW5TPQ8_9SPHI
MREVIFSGDLAQRFKMEEQNFTRNRKQPFSATLLFMINLLRTSLAIEIDGFVRYLNERFTSQNTPSFTSSAFVQNRKKIKPTVFKHLSSVIIENYYTADNESLILSNGFRILAVDGSRITLPMTLELKACYGVTKNQSEVEIVQARSSVLYDVLNGVTLDAVLENLSIGERELALRHATQWKKNDLIIYDRGYPSYDFVNEHIKQHIDCLIRVKVSYSLVVATFVRGGKKSIITEIYPKEKQSFEGKDYNKNTGLKVRLLRIELPSGEIEVLMTTLMDSKKYPSKMFKELYFLRWGVETFYDELKNKLKIEWFTGYSQLSIQQDFFCAIFISNLQSVIVNDIKGELHEQNKDRKYNYKVNTNLSYGFLKNRIMELLYLKAPLDNIFRELKNLFLKNTVPVRNNRVRHVGKYRGRIRPKVTKNQRDAI